MKLSLNEWVCTDMNVSDLGKSHKAYSGCNTSGQIGSGFIVCQIWLSADLGLPAVRVVCLR